jgi:hypothetical protein
MLVILKFVKMSARKIFGLFQKVTISDSFSILKAEKSTDFGNLTVD